MGAFLCCRGAGLNHPAFARRGPEDAAQEIKNTQAAAAAAAACVSSTQEGAEGRKGVGRGRGGERIHFYAIKRSKYSVKEIFGAGLEREGAALGRRARGPSGAGGSEAPGLISAFLPSISRGSAPASYALTLAVKHPPSPEHLFCI